MSERNPERQDAPFIVMFPTDVSGPSEQAGDVAFLKETLGNKYEIRVADKWRELDVDDDSCPHGCGVMMKGVQGDPLEPEEPYCPTCGHMKGHGCDDYCNWK